MPDASDGELGGVEIGAAESDVSALIGDVQRSSPWRPTIERAMAALAAGIDAGERLGLDTGGARAVQVEALARLRLPIDMFVMALVGGTGVGKSSLVNALAGTEVSTAGPRRPTTNEPVAWVSRRELALDEILHRLDVRRIVEGDGAAGSSEGGAEGRDASIGHRLGLAILDLPDLDSVDESHRRRVDEVLPKLDAVLWVVDHEKYADAALIDGYVTKWAPRLGRQALVVNKTDLLRAGDAEMVSADVEALMAARGLHLPVVRASAAAGSGDGLDRLRRWIDDLVREKAAAATRLRAAARVEVASLAAEAGISEAGAFAPLVPADVRRAAVAATDERLAATVGLERLSRVATDATRHTAAETGGPLAVFRFAARYAGLGASHRMQAREFLESWRDRSSLLEAAEPGAAAFGQATAVAPAALRPLLAEAGRPLAIARRLEGVADSIPRSMPADELVTPTARGWGLLNTVKAVAVAAVVVAAISYLAALFVRLPLQADVSRLPVVIAAAVVAGLLAQLLLVAHARLVGRRWARRLAIDARRVIGRDVPAALFGVVDEAEGARATLRRAILALPPEDPAPR